MIKGEDLKTNPNETWKSEVGSIENLRETTKS